MLAEKIRRGDSVAPSKLPPPYGLPRGSAFGFDENQNKIFGEQEVVVNQQGSRRLLDDVKIAKALFPDVEPEVAKGCSDFLDKAEIEWKSLAK
jgi:hypothetical protein